MTRRESIDSLRSAAWEALESDPDRALGLARRALELRPDAEGWYLLGIARAEAGHNREAITALARTVELDPSHVDGWAGLGRALFDDYQWEAAAGAIHAALRVDVAHPEARTVRAWLRERRGDWDGAWRDYLVAAAENPQDYPLPVLLDDETIARVADEVVEALHPSLQRYLESVPILIDEVPSEDLLRELEPPGRPAELLGCFSGDPLPMRSTLDTGGQLPATIVLYRRNLQRIAQDEPTLHEELRVTLLHEIGHFLGLDEEDLAERGLD